MITRRTKLQLLVFVLITLLGVTYVGAKYAKLDRFVRTTDYPVTVHLASSGGLFAGSEVTYRGVEIGRVKSLVLTEQGVDAVLSIEKSYDTIPSDTLAVVGNRSAVGEQYLELQPQTDDAPYLKADSQIKVADTRTPLPTEKLLADLSDTVSSVDQQALSTTIDELGKAFSGTGPALQRLIDSGTSFIQTANDNFETTTALIRDSNTVLRTQVDQTTALKTFASQLSQFSSVLAGADPDLRRLIDNGSGAAIQLRTFIEDNQVELGSLINNAVTTGRVIVKNIPGIQQFLVVYPYVVEGAFSVVAKTPATGLYDAHFGLILSTKKPCEAGYQDTKQQTPQSSTRFDDLPMNTKARCTEPATRSNPRGEQNLRPRVGADYSGGTAPTVASFDPATGRLTWGDPADDPRTSAQVPAGSVAPATLGEDSWKWLFLQPLTAGR